MKGNSRGKPVVSKQFRVMKGSARTSRQLRGDVTLQCRERETERDRKRERDRDRARVRERDRERQRETEREREREREKKKEKKGERDRETRSSSREVRTRVPFFFCREAQTGRRQGKEKEEREAGEDGEDGEQREGERTAEHTGEETRERGTRRKARGQCRRTELEPLKFCAGSTFHKQEQQPVPTPRVRGKPGSYRILQKLLKGSIFLPITHPTGRVLNCCQDAVGQSEHRHHFAGDDEVVRVHVNLGT